MNYREKMRKAIECPQFGDSAYGEWGTLTLEQRKLIRRLLDELDRADEYNKQLYFEKDELEQTRLNAIKFIKSTYFYGMRSGKTLLSKYLNELLVILGDKNE